jgi:hypothetical protein
MEEEEKLALCYLTTLFEQCAAGWEDEHKRLISKELKLSGGGLFNP